MEKFNMRLNSMDNKLFDANAVSATDETIGTGADKLSRNKIIASGRACAVDYMGRHIARGTGSYVSRFDGSAMSYKALSQAHNEQKFLYCAAMAYASIGAQPPQNIEQVRKDVTLWKNPTFLATLARIDTEVVTPMLYDVFSDLGNGMFNMDSVGLGETKQIDIQSNDIFLWEDGSWGSGHSTTKNYLYADTVTMNPRQFNANGTIKWFQMVATDGGMDAGSYYAALIRGMWSKVMAMATAALTDSAAQSAYIPSYLRFNSYSSANWAAATQAVAVANGVNRDRLMAFGEYAALQAVLPSGTPVDASLTFGISDEWMKNGFVSMVGRVPLYEVMPALLPGTINTTGDMIGLNDQIFITARVGDGLAPVYVCFVDGWPVTLEYTPSTTANFTIDITMSTLLDVKGIWAGRIAVISNVTI